MPKSKFIVALLILTLIASAIGVGSIFARGRDPGQLTVRELNLKAVPAAAAVDKLTSLIVKLDDASLASYQGGVAGLAATSPSSTGKGLDLKSADSLAYLAYLDAKINAFEAAAVQALPGSRVMYRYRATIGGVSMLVPSDQVNAVARLPGVKAVYPDTLLQVDTENSPGFVGAPALWRELGGSDDAGEGIIVGVLDTGIWPEHPSYADPDPSGEAYAAPPATWTGTACDFGNTAWNPNDAPFTCNNKLIGAATFLDTYRVFSGLLPEEFDSARDSEGHGTHTSSTAAGNGHVDAVLLGVDRGEISGIAPRAHVAMYRVCGIEGCYTTDSAAAVEQAIVDGVNVINFSISGGENPYTDIVSLAFLDAYNAGVFVAASAGNAGPGADTTDHREPWTTTVAASTQNRAFVSTVTVTADNGDELVLKGASVTAGISTPTAVVSAADFGDELCLSPFTAGAFSGEIVICKRGTNARVDKGYNVLQGGAGGMILYNQSTAVTDVETDNHFLPTAHVQFTDGDALLSFLSSHTAVTATSTDGVATSSQGDVMASFSSRGGPLQSLGISKPDVTAPGVQILAGHTPLPDSTTGGPPGELFQAIAGTSMSSPHVAGSAALLKHLHPDWTPGQIKSALMTTAKTTAVKEDGLTRADAFDFGSGRIALARAMEPGLTISAAGQDFVDHEVDLWNTDYPSVYVPVMPGRVTVQRTLHSELDRQAWWRVSAHSDRDVKVMVPRRVRLSAGGDATLDITIDARNVPEGETRFATILLRHGKYVNRIPIVIVRHQPNVTMSKSCDPGTIEEGDATTCTITIENTVLGDANVSLTDRLPRQLRLVPGSVVGADQNGNGIAFSGTLGAAGAPVVDVAEDPFAVGFGYLSLADLGVSPFQLPGNADDGGWILTGAAINFNYLGQHYDSVIWSVNGTLELGDSSGTAASASNVQLPSTAIPNNLLAAWWTDLDLTNAGNWYVAVLTDGVNDWTVFEWENVPRFGDASSTATFQIWLQIGTDIIWYAYDTFVGNTSDGTVGAEDPSGTIGDTYYYGEGGVGTLPDGSLFDLLVNSVPGTPGETKVVTFQATGRDDGRYQNCAELTADVFFGTNIACFSGAVRD